MHVSYTINEYTYYIIYHHKSIRIRTLYIYLKSGNLRTRPARLLLLLYNPKESGKFQKKEKTKSKEWRLLVEWWGKKKWPQGEKFLDKQDSWINQSREQREGRAIDDVSWIHKNLLATAGAFSNCSAPRASRRLPHIR